MPQHRPIETAIYIGNVNLKRLRQDATQTTTQQQDVGYEYN